MNGWGIYKKGDKTQKLKIKTKLILPLINETHICFEHCFMLLWNTATGDFFHKTMLHSFIPYKGNHLKIHPNFSRQRLSKAPHPSETWPWLSAWFLILTKHTEHSPSTAQLLGDAVPLLNWLSLLSAPVYPACWSARRPDSAGGQKTTLAACKKNLSESQKRQILLRMSVAGEARSWTRGRRILTQAMVQT